MKLYDDRIRAVLAVHPELVVWGTGQLTLKLLSETAEYLRTRKQFGVTIGSFQSPQHQMARMLMDYEKARALMLRFAFTLENATFDSTSVESARYIAETAIALAEGCLHLHGGMGITAEAFAGQSLKRMQLLRAISC